MTIWGAAALLAALVGLLVLVFLLRWQYGKELMAKVWPAGPFTIGSVGTAVPESRTILLLGDSRISEWDFPQIGGWRVLNAGAGGATTAQLASGCRPLLHQVHPQIVVLQVGINDLKLLGVRPDLARAVIGGCVSNILTIVAECRQSGARVLVMPVWPAGRVSLARRVVWSRAVDPAVAETNARLERLLANQEGVEIIDIFSELTRGLSTGQRQRLYRDTLHLKPETYARLSPLLADAISTRVK
jgi:lysophospholipase L1-like esterase